MSRFKPYPAYKDSGVEWLGEVPEHWIVANLRRLIVSVSNGTTATQIDASDDAIPVSRIETISTGEINYDRVGYVSPDDVDERFLLAPGNILFSHINSLSMVGNVAIYDNDQPLLHGMNLLRLQPQKSVCSRWLYYWIKSKNLREEVESRAKPAINQASISTDSVRSLPALILPKAEQTQIVSFLDHETVRIDALIAEQRRLIELLKEKRQAVISHAVTKGIDPTVPMKDSGVEWLGEVPAHWKVSRVKYIACLISKGTTPTTIGAEFQESGVRFIKAENIEPGNVASTPEFFISNDAHEMLKRSALQAHDVLVVIAGATTGRSGVISKELLPANTNQAVSFIRPCNATFSDFMQLWLSTEAVQRSILLNSVQSAQPNLSMEDLGNLPIPVPAEMEIIELIMHLKSRLCKHDSLINEAYQTIEFLKERRSALISAAVTGKIDVRAWQRPSPAVQREPELELTNG